MLKKLILLFLLTTNIITSQSQIKLPTGYAEVGLRTGFGEHAPFWMVSNKYGVESIKNNSILLRTAIKTELRKEKRFDFSYGFDLIGLYDKKGDAFVQQAYLQAKFYFLNIYVGKKEELFGNQDSVLSSGGVVWSGNAPPIPKISISTNGYIEVPFTKGFIEFNVYLAHGWFGNDGYVKHAYLHQKQLYLRFGGNSKIHFKIGLQHYAQWGGIHPVYGDLPNGFKNYLRVFFAKDNIGTLDTLTTPKNEAFNRIGNHLGTKDVGIDYQINKRLSVKIYWQNFIEDITGLGFRNIEDGLWGLVVDCGEIRTGYEFIHTLTRYLPYGQYQYYNNDYFNNGIYKSGWTYKGYVIGTPFIISPVLFAIDSLYNNRLLGHHCSIQIKLNSIEVLAHYSWTKNIGNYYVLFKPPKIQNSIMISLRKRELIKQKFEGIICLAMDYGALYGNNYGFNTSVRWYF